MTNSALSYSLGMAPAIFTSVLVSVLHCTVIDLDGKSVVIPQPQTAVSAAAVSCSVDAICTHFSPSLAGKLPLPYPTCAWSTQTHSFAAPHSQGETLSSTQKSLESCSQTCWHYRISFNLTSLQCTVSIIWLIWYNKHKLCCCSWSDLCCHFMGS